MNAQSFHSTLFQFIIGYVLEIIIFAIKQQNAMDVNIEESWKQHVGAEFGKQYFVDLVKFVKEEYLHYHCFPQGKYIFNAFNLCPFDDVKVVIIGQDPYHEIGQAHGLSFSVCDGVPFPPSLVNIFREIQMDTGKPMPKSGNLTRWAKQGVLLLNATLTVRAHQAGSHQRKGWEQFTDAAIQALSESRDHLVFMLWGGYARSKVSLINQRRHLVLQSVHPSPLSANRGGWFGNHHFSRCNAYLEANGEKPIDW
jgi:uracil-DNA glycosylase